MCHGRESGFYKSGLGTVRSWSSRISFRSADVNVFDFVDMTRECVTEKLNADHGVILCYFRTST